MIWRRLEDLVIGILAVMALVLICNEFIMRKFYPTLLPDWGTEFVIYFTVWAMLLAGAPLVRDSRHVRADILLRHFSPGWQRFLEIFVTICGIIFTAVVFWYGLSIVELAFRLDEKSESSMRFPLYIYYAFVPLGFGLMAGEYVIRLYRLIFRFDPETMLVTDEHVMRDK
ncbi:MAG: TRAP transporter small permease [Hyphomicrobiaceae bacterium]|nr:TRAP transporter small permease [Hyphomicrobiaceae bacterium]